MILSGTKLVYLNNPGNIFIRDAHKEAVRLKKIYLAKAKVTVELKETRKEILRLKQESVKEAGQAKDVVALKLIQDLEGK